MASGIRVTVEFPAPAVCPAVELSEREGAVVETCATSVGNADAPAGVTDVLATTDEGGDVDGLRHIFSYGSKHVYRLTHDGDVGCPCEHLGRHGCPIDRYFARDGRLELVFHAAGFEELQDAVADLREEFPDVDIKRLVRSPASGSRGDSVFVDRSKLTRRQLEVLRTAYEMGYFERPRGANATTVAAALDIDASTFSEHLAAAQTKLLEDVLEEGS